MPASTNSSPAHSTLQATLDRLTRPAQLVESLKESRVCCLACGHRCRIPDGRRGICRVRYNDGGVLQAPYGYVAGLHKDPIEKKPFYHFLPGTNGLTFGMLGCCFHCPFCQNWISSQALRDERAGIAPDEITVEQVMETAQRTRSKTVVSSYNEPLITAEWAVEIFKQAREAGLRTACVSNGNATPEVLDYLRPHTDGFKVDLKSMNDRTYRRLGGVRHNVLDTIQQAWDLGFWVEVVTLVVPGLNDTDEELQSIAAFIAGVSPDIPWHVTAFHRDYKLLSGKNTSVRQLLRAWELGRQAGLNYVYGGNLPGEVPEMENTYCPACDATLIRRVGYYILDNHITPDDKCSECGTKIPGVWA
ncbi:MAG: AmmeMemoRadiSam system radical SAM enzyme [Fidelibacterota bacterium]|nr:MAG: AmmeMemoRadiSam system radical SAM enzyme [Candidatus Neomarinimicrobiota bacterium]